MRGVLRVPVLAAMVVAGVMLMDAQALAEDSTVHTRNSRRQIADCIIKRMSANRMVSFNDATRACKDVAKAQDDSNLASNAPAKPVNGR
jgi:ribosome recycling factor